MSNTDLPQRLAQLRNNIRAAAQQKFEQQPPIDVEIVEEQRDDD